jgi:hypothetical protein
MCLYVTTLGQKGNDQADLDVIEFSDCVQFSRLACTGFLLSSFCLRKKKENIINHLPPRDCGPRYISENSFKGKRVSTLIVHA